MLQKIQKLLYEMIPVVLGILIALFLNNLKEKADKKRFFNRIMGAIEVEMEQNVKQLDTVMIGQAKLLDTLLHYQNNDTLTLTEIIIKGNGLKGTQLKNTSWKSFFNSNMELLDYSLINTLSEIEEDKELIQLKMSKILEFIYEHVESTEPKKKTSLGFLIGDLYQTEEAVVENLNTFLQSSSER